MEKKVEIVDKKQPYTTIRFDFFNQQTKITRAFIRKQNTLFMKQKAEGYSLALVVEMIWTD